MDYEKAIGEEGDPEKQQELKDAQVLAIGMLTSYFKFAQE